MNDAVIAHEEPTLNLRFLRGRLQQEWLVHLWIEGIHVTKSRREWRDVVSVETE